MPDNNENGNGTNEMSPVARGLSAILRKTFEKVAEPEEDRTKIGAFLMNQSNQVAGEVLNDQRFQEGAAGILANEAEQAGTQIRENVNIAMEASAEATADIEIPDMYRYIRDRMTTPNETAWQKITRGVTARLLSVGARLGGFATVFVAESMYTGGNEGKFEEDERQRYQQAMRKGWGWIFGQLFKRRQEEGQTAANGGGNPNPAPAGA